MSSTKSDTSDLNESLLYDITKDILKELNKPKNKKKLKEIGTFIFNSVKLYLYTIILILILIFVMNTIQFYYYISNFKVSSGNLPK